METKIATSVNQSKTLIELGIDVNTADMYWEYDYFQKFHRLELFEDGFPKTLNKDDIPAWSLSALLNLIPNENDNGRNYCYIEVYVGYYTVSYCNNWDGRIFSTKSNKCLLDAAFEMMCYLIENKLI